MKIDFNIKQDYPYVICAILTVIGVFGVTAYFNHEFNRVTEAVIDNNEQQQIYKEMVERIPFDELKDGTLSNGAHMVVKHPLDYPEDKVAIVSKYHIVDYTYQVENDNGKSKITVEMNELCGRKGSVSY